MGRKLAFAIALLLAGCAPKAPAPVAPPGEAVAEPEADGGRRDIEERSDLIAFSYSWPGAAEALPGLRRRLEQQMALDRTDATGHALSDRDGRRQNDIPFNPHDFSKSWAVLGEAPRLLSLAAQIYTFQGGAHGNTAYDDLLWDRMADASVSRAKVLPPALLVAVTGRYCAALDRAREQKRGEPVTDRGSIFNDCPSIDEQVVAPADSDGNGRFDMLAVILAPYTAGPYVEGSYELELPIDAATLEAIPEAWRGEFEIKG